MTTITTLYRYQNHQDVVDLETLHVIKRTPCGCWIRDRYDPLKKRFVLDGGKKRYAYPTKEEAKASFLARKRHELAHLQRRIKNVEHAVQNMEAGHLGWMGVRNREDEFDFV